MKTILKIGDRVYAQSLQNFVPSYLVGFPQREQFLLEHMSGISFDFFRHDVLDDIDGVLRGRENLANYLADKNFDYLMVDNPLSGLVIEGGVKIPIIFDCIDWYKEMYLKEFGEDERYHLLCYGLLELVKRASKVVAQSPVMLKSLEDMALKSEDMVVIPNGYNPEIFYPYDNLRVAELRERLSKKHGVDIGRRSAIVYTGKLGRWYDNIITVAEAITDDQVFFIVGDGPIVKEIPDRSNVIKCGRVSLSEVPDYTNIADVLVFPVNVDCSPIAISEYLAIGKPIVMGRGRMEWLLRDGESGAMVDNTVDSWKDGISRALRIKDSCRENNLGLAKNLSWQKLSMDLTVFLSS